MSTIDEAVEFFTAFFDAEFKVQEANYANATTFSRRYAKMRKMLKEPHLHEIHRVDHGNLKRMAKTAVENYTNWLARRQLYLVEQHDISERKRVYCAYASHDRHPSIHSTYDLKFWADNSLLIIGAHWPCSDCHGLGILKGARCRECSGRGWYLKSGDSELSKVGKGKPTAFKKLLRPSWPECAQHYDSL